MINYLDDRLLALLTNRVFALLVLLPLTYFGFASLAISFVAGFDLGNYLRVALYIELAAGVTLLFSWVVDWLSSTKLESTKAFIFKYGTGGALGMLTIYALLPPDFPVHSGRKPPLVPGLLHVFLVTLLIASFRFILQQKKEKEELKKDYKILQYQALKSQLNPHFLFNTLNLISSEIEYDPRNANTILEDLADLLRNVLNASSKKLVSLEQEIAMVELYLDIQKKRFEEYLDYHIDYPSGCSTLMIPPLIMQPLIENAFVHGFSVEAKQWQLNVMIKKTDTHLSVCIIDNGAGCNPQEIKEGYGISVIKDTLQLLYGQNHRFQIRSSPHQGTEVSIHIPIGGL